MPTLPPLSLALRAHPTQTHLLVRDGGQTLLTGWLPPAPAHPDALPRLSAGLALWWNRPLHVVLDVADPEAWWSGAPHWDAIVGPWGGRRVTLQAVVAPTPTATRVGLDHARGPRPHRGRA
jgi:hypothetical protein